jgi:c-di-GMP-binding flagellar brake protein YcgR
LLISEIPIGSKVELEVRYSGRTLSFDSDVKLIINNTILITPIVFNDQTVGFNDNCRINLIVKVDGKVYLWNNVTVKLVRYDGAIYHKVDAEGKGVPYNRREAYRMYIGEDMPLYVNTANGPLALSVLVKDLSETGVAFITKEELDIDRIVRLKIKDKNLILNMSAVIVRKEFLPHLDSFLYGCKFNERNNKLGNYIARKQGEALRKRTGNYSSPPAKYRNTK